MSSYTTKDLQKQFDFIIKSGWIELFESSAAEFSFPPEILIAIASRETNINPKYQHAKGDGGHGHSIMQIDDRSFPDFCKSDDWKDPAKAIRMGAQVLKNKLDEVQRVRGIPETDRLRIAIAAYNCGARRACDHYLNGRSPDTSTTGKDYSADVGERARFFNEKLAELKE